MKTRGAVLLINLNNLEHAVPPKHQPAVTALLVCTLYSVDHDWSAYVRSTRFDGRNYVKLLMCLPKYMNFWEVLYA